MINVSRYELVGSSRATTMSWHKTGKKCWWSRAQPPPARSWPRPHPPLPPATTECPWLQQQKKEDQAHHVAMENLMTSVLQTLNSCNRFRCWADSCFFYHSGLTEEVEPWGVIRNKGFVMEPGTQAATRAVNRPCKDRASVWCWSLKSAEKMTARKNGCEVWGQGQSVAPKNELEPASVSHWLAGLQRGDACALQEKLASFIMKLNTQLARNLRSRKRRSAGLLMHPGKWGQRPTTCLQHSRTTCTSLTFLT